MSRRFTVRIESDGDDFIVSPPLGPGGLCQVCWTLRRLATMDCSRLCPESGDSERLVAAYEHAVTRQRPSRPAQRRVIAAVIRARRREAHEPDRRRAPAALTRVGADGAASSEVVLALPGCRDCASAAAREQSRPVADVVTGRAAGIVPEWKSIPPLPGEPSYPNVVVTRLANSTFDHGRPFWAGASGKGDTERAALESGIGESLEKYAASRMNMTPRVARASELDEPHIAPCRLSGMSAARARSAGYDPDGPLAWVHARSIDDEARVSLVPASAVYLRLPPPLRRPVGVPYSSNGLACAPALDLAIARGIGEVIERHIFFQVWYGRRAADSVVPDDVVSGLTGAPEFHAAGLLVRVVVLGSMSGITVASASCWPNRPRRGAPGFVLGLGHGESAQAAMQGAMREMAQVYRGLTWALQDDGLRGRAEQLQGDASRVEDPYDHALYFAGRPAERVPSPFGRGPRRAVDDSFAGPDAADAGRWVVDLTPGDIVEAASLHIVRVIAPDLIPYHYGAARIPDLHVAPYLMPLDAADLVHPLC